MNKAEEKEFEKMINEVTMEAAGEIIPKLRTVNANLRGPIDKKTKEMNFQSLQMFIVEVYNKGIQDGIRLSSIK